jgi:hypothetical protein
LIRIFRASCRSAAEEAFGGGLNETIAFPLFRSGDCHLGLGFDSGQKRRRESFADRRRQDGRGASTWAIGWDTSRRVHGAKGYDFVRARGAP